MPPDFTAKYSQIIHIHWVRTLRLEPGDKLATRHGHKGVVGLILPDERMPHWAGKPLEALIDPISVLNRLNWGQMYESLAGAVAENEQMEASEHSPDEWLQLFIKKYLADSEGRVKLSPPGEGWLKSRDGSCFLAMAGVQFVMRMPQNAAEKIHDPRDNPRQRAKLSLGSHFALWAHNLQKGGTTKNLTEGALELHPCSKSIALSGIVAQSVLPKPQLIPR